MMNHTLRRLAHTALVLGALVAGLSGCRSYPAAHGRDRNIVATFKGFTLSADLPAPASVSSANAAAMEVFKARGYAIRESKVTADVGTIMAIPPRARDYPRVLCSITRAGESTRIELTNQPLADEEICRSVLDGILKRLGM
jgi:hypothetical protein